MRRTLMGVVGFAGALVASAAGAQQEGDPTAGRRLAEAWCSGCHAIGPGASGPASNAAPTLPAVARMHSTTGMSLHAFLLTPHPPMPDIQMSRGQIDDVVAYILGLRGR